MGVAENIPTLGNITPYPFQWEVAQNCLSHIRQILKGDIEPEPAYVNAYVSAGKTIICGIIADHCERVGAKLLILSRTGELIKQNSEEVVNMGGHCSVYSASLNVKSVHFSTVAGSEGTVANGLHKEFKSWVPHVIVIDECHEVDHNDVLDQGEKQYSKILNHFRRMNPRLAIIGLTGSPYRGIESIKGEFWKHVIKPEIDRKFLVDGEYIVPTIFGFGHDDVQYDLSGFDAENELGTKDFSDSQLEQMHERMSISATKSIMKEVVSVMQSRISALITCAGLKHCQEAASCVPQDEMAIITSAMPDKERIEIMDDLKKGVLNNRGTLRYKYVFQVGCLTTGVNVPLWDTSVILRRIGSLTLLTQLLGRGMRLLKQWMVDEGYSKVEHVVLDYSGTMDSMFQMFDDPILEEAMRSKDDSEKNFKTCPECNMMVGEHARRCQCGHWFKYRECEDTEQGGVITEFGCGAKNDIAARVCSNCGKYLIDPNERLSGKHYSDADWKPVIDMRLFVAGTKQDAIKVVYLLDSYGLDGQREVAEVFFWAINAGGKRAWESNFCRRHIDYYPNVKKFAQLPAVKAVQEYKKYLNTPKCITHRKVNGKSVVHGLDFGNKKLLGNKKAS